MRGINLATVLEHTTSAHPDKIGLIFDNSECTFKEIDQKAGEVAKGLSDLGIKRGDRISLFLPNVPEFFFWFFGVLKTGAVVNPLNVMLKKKEIEYILGDCAPKLLVTTNDVAEEPLKIFRESEGAIEHMVVIGENDFKDVIKYESWRKKFEGDYNSVFVEKEDLAAILYTSGTTG